MNTNIFQRIKLFNEESGTEVDRLQLLPAEAENEVRMLAEELEELQTALVTGYKRAKLGEQSRPFTNVQEQRIEILDALCDIIYVAAGTAAKLGFDLEGALSEVCWSNESKKDLNGNYEKDANGKIIKGDNFIPPDLSAFI